MPPRTEIEFANPVADTALAPTVVDRNGGYGDEDDTAPRRLPDRWTPDPALPGYARRQPPRPPFNFRLSEVDKVRLLVGAIGGLTLVLAGLVVYALLPGADGGVTLPINVRREVSDAATAARNAAATLDVRQTFMVFDGRDPTIFESAPDNPVRLDHDNGGGGFTRVSSSVDAPGIKAVIGPGLANELAGQRVRVTITARSSRERGAATLRFAYQSGLAISHWQTASLEPNYAGAALIWRVPTQRTSSNGADYLIIEPGIPGDGTAVDISSIKIDLLPPA
jgi:hypothetical protein